MAVKTFRAKSIPAAIRRIKEEMGTDAVILATRRIDRKARDPYNADQFEVDAAPAGDAPVDPARQPKGSGTSGKTDPRREERSDVRDTGVFDERALASLKSELVGIKDMLYLMSRHETLPDIVSDHPEFLNLYARLVGSGMSETRARRFLVAGCRWKKESVPDAKATARSVLSDIMNRISVSRPFNLAENLPRRRLAAFVGPTGVGKTTTIAKIAAQLFLKERRSVGLVSIDSFRMGALEQLKAYATIMGIPCLPAFTPNDLKIAVAKLRQVEVVLIDTAGHSHLDEERMKHLHELMAGEAGIESHLVLSAANAPQDMKEAAERFSCFDPVSYVFTKLDETRRRAAVLEQVMDRPLPISFMTNGQRVPEDLIPARKSDIIPLVFSGTA